MDLATELATVREAGADASPGSHVLVIDEATAAIAADSTEAPPANITSPYVSWVLHPVDSPTVTLGVTPCVLGVEPHADHDSGACPDTTTATAATAAATLVDWPGRSGRHVR